MTVEWASSGDPAAVAERIAATLARPGAKRIAVPGGSTPARVFAALRERALDWRGCEVWLTDDRQVPHDHPASNFGKLREALGETGATLVELVEDAKTPRFDLVWLGMGLDGHIASLFPRMCAGQGRRPRVIATRPIPLPAEAPYPRLSLNRAALARTDAVILVISGAAKRAVIERAMRADDLPVSDFLRSSGGPPVTIYWSE